MCKGGIREGKIKNKEIKIKEMVIFFFNLSQNKVRRGTATQIGHMSVPKGLLKHLVMDYVDMIYMGKGNESSRGGAGAEIKFLTKK